MIILDEKRIEETMDSKNKKSVDSNKESRVIFIDFLRIIACFLIIANHTGWLVVVYTEPSPVWFVSLLYFCISRIAIPIFIMITGYVTLNKAVSYDKSFKRAGRFAILLVLFSLVYYLNGILTNNIVEYSIVDFFKKLIGGPINNILWYLYLYIGLSIMMPFIQKMVSKFEKKDFHVYLAISFIVCSIWPTVVHYVPSLNYSGFLALQIFNDYIFLLILGYYYKKYGFLFTKNKYVIILIFSMSSILNVILTYVEYVRLGGDNYFFYANVTCLPILVAAMSFFNLASQMRFNDKIVRIISFVGKLTLGIYLVAELFIEKLGFIYNKLCAIGINSMISVIIYAVVVFICSGVVVFVLKKIPGIKKLL